MVGKLINAKVNFGLGAPIKANNEMPKFTDELAEKLYKPVTRKFQSSIVNVNGIDEIWAADLIDMQAFSKDNNETKYLLTIIDIFSKFCLDYSFKAENWTGSCKRIFEDLKGTKT